MVVTVCLVALFLYWLIGMFLLAIPMAIRVYRTQFEVGHFLAWWEWASTFTFLPLFWPALVLDLIALRKRRRREK